MLNFFREGSKTWISKVVIWFVALTFVASAFLVWSMRETQDGGVAATVAGEVITRRQFSESVKQMEEGLRRQFGGQLDAATLKALNVESVALNSLVGRALQVRAAREAGIIISDEELATVIQSIPDFKVNGVFDRQRYTNYLNRTGVSPAIFEEGFKTDLMVAKLAAMVERSVRVSSLEARNHYMFENQPVAVDFVKINATDMERNLKFTVEDLKKWFEGKKEEFRLPESRSFRALMMEPSAFTSKVTVTEDEISGYYTAHTAEFETPDEVHARHILVSAPANAPAADVEKAEKKIKRAHERVAGGEDFAAVAREMSEDPAGKNGGDLGSFKKGMMVPEFEKVAFAMDKGDISKPFRTQFGFHVVQSLSRTIGRIPPLAEVKGDVERKVRGAKARPAAQAALKALVMEIRPENFASVTDKHPEVKINSYTTPKGRRLPGFSDSTKVTEVVFGLKEKTVSDVVELPEGFLVAMVDAVHPSYVPALEAIGTAVTARYKAEKGIKEAEDTAAKIEKMVNEGKPLADAAKSFGQIVGRTQPYSRANVSSATVKGDGVMMEAFELGDGEARNVQVQGGYAVLKVASRHAVDEKEMAAKLPELQKSLLAKKRERVYAEFVSNLKKKAEADGDIKIHVKVEGKTGA
ncbi:MAG: SurA N-terminal domain-containing protein [Nitrospinae bacterium]|nr:SurA N-terminal domain-containing protein [Nitrospinota bacterium]